MQDGHLTILLRLGMAWLQQSGRDCVATSACALEASIYSDILSIEQKCS